MNKKDLIIQTEAYVKNCLKNDFSGHDWNHIHRVRNLALHIGQRESGNLFLIEMAALLHDVGDPKLHKGDESKLLALPREFCHSQNIDPDTTAQILKIIKEVSYKGAKVADRNSTTESKIVQDADRLDAIGAIGVARCLYFGGHHSRELHNPDIPPQLHTDYESYRKSKGTTINHFYEKLLLLKDRLHTETAKELAIQRHRFMENFLDQFLSEWNF